MTPYSYLTGKDGHYVFKKNPVFSSLVRASDHPDFPELDEFFQLNAPKIPFDLVVQATSFLRAVYQQFKTEAILLLTYS